MNQKTFQTLLTLLRPETLAHLVADLEEAQEEWQFYPEDAPPAAVQTSLAQAVVAARQVGAEQVRADNLVFAEMVEQIEQEREEAEDWFRQRNRQVRQNWLSDLE
jgi:hypothetical protein